MEQLKCNFYLFNTASEDAIELIHNMTINEAIKDAKIYGFKNNPRTKFVHLPALKMNYLGSFQFVPEDHEKIRNWIFRELPENDYFKAMITELEYIKKMLSELNPKN